LAWNVEYDPEALTDLKRLDRTVQNRIVDSMDDRVSVAADPRDFGKPLRHAKFGLWRYRVRDYRIVQYAPRLRRRDSQAPGNRRAKLNRRERLHPVPPLPWL
jgi:mRNA interferase RelE/StbE